MESSKSHADQHTENKSHGFETPSLQKARGGQHRPGPTLPTFHIHAPFPISSPCSYLITEVLQFEYLDLILDPKLTMHLDLWKSIVLPHFLQNPRYIKSTTDVTKLQTSLNLSLARALHVYGDHTALLADTGVPPLNLIQYTHLAQFHFRLTKTHSDTLPATLCLRLLTTHLPSITFIPLPSTTTSGTHFTNSTLTPSSTLSPT